MKIFCVRIGDRYGPEYETYLEQKLPEYNIHWIREEVIGRLQWNKLLAMSYTDIDEPIVCLLYTSPSPRDLVISRMPSSA